MVSLVITARNDDHGGNLLGRMQLFVDNLLEQCRLFQLPIELIIVEWNPAEEKQKLAQALKWPSVHGNVKIRVIEVSNKIHSKFKHSEYLPLFQMIAKNAGIRRASGDFILATNIDILFSNELIKFIASNRLKKRRMYRIDRYDVPEDIPPNASASDRLEICRKNVIRICSRDGIRNLNTGGYHEIYSSLNKKGMFREKCQNWGWLPVSTRSRIHTNTCGDFTLLAKKHWFDLKGYPEFEMYSFHIDSVFCHMAHHGGAREELLVDPMRIYHIEHSKGSGWTPEGKEALDKRLKRNGVPQLSHSQFDEWAVYMRRWGKPIIFNDDDWGLAEFDLQETIV